MSVELLAEKGLACVFLEDTVLRTLFRAMNTHRWEEGGDKEKTQKKGVVRKAEMCSKDFSPSSWFGLHTRSASK